MKTITNYNEINALGSFTGFIIGQVWFASEDGAAPTLPQGRRGMIPATAGEPIERKGFFIRYGGYEYIKPEAVVVIESPEDWQAADRECDRLLRRAPR